MNDLTPAASAVSAATLEQVLATGDLSKLTPRQRLEYYVETCRTVGLNPLTRPFRFLTLNGQVQLYATRDCTDQLRRIHKISLFVKDQRIDGDIFVVTCSAKSADGREDEDIGAVTMGRLQGESRANAAMKAVTKAKRRVTLSICGLGLLSEDELDTLPGARTFDAEEEMPAREQINRDVPLTPPERTPAELLASMEIAMRNATSLDAVNKIIANRHVQDMLRDYQGDDAERLKAIIAQGIAAHAPEEGAAEPPPAREA